MNIMAIWALINCIIIIWLGQFIYYQNKHDPLNRIFAALCLVISLWAFSSFMFLNAHDIRDAFIWMKMNALFWTMPSALVLHFSLVFAGKKKAPARRFLYLCIYAPAIVFAALDFSTNLMTRGPTPAFGRFEASPRLTSGLFLIGSLWTIGLAVAAVVLCIGVYLNTGKFEKRQQAKYIAVGFSIPIITAVLTSLVLPALGVKVPNLTISSMTGLAVFVAFAIYRYRLFTVNPATAAENIISTMHDSLILIDPEGIVLSANEATFEMLGYDQSELTGQPAARIFADPELGAKISGAPNDGPAVKNQETTYRAKDGRPVSVLFSSSRIQNDQGALAGSVIVAKDISKRKKAEEALKFSEERFRAIADTAVDALITIDSKSRILFWNKSAERQFGYSAEEAVGREVSIIVPERYRTAHKRSLARFLAGGEPRIVGKTVELQALRRDGHEFPVELSIAASADDRGITFTGILRDITERKQAQSDIKHMAYHDQLTDLPNRNLMLDRLHQNLASAKRNRQMLAFLYLDQNKFKRVNDELGHDAGDYLLKVISARLVGCLRETDTVARVGGDEFNILLPNIHQVRDASESAEKIFDSVSAPFLINERKVSVTAGIGISIYPNDGKTSEALICRADSALRHARATGRKYHFFTKRIRGQTIDHLRLEKDLGNALPNHEFVIHYQPCVDLSSGRIVAIEALLRWQHPRKGLLSPDAFIPLAEETGLIEQIGDWALFTACRQHRDWQRAGFTTPILSVNLSDGRLEQVDLPETVGNILDTAGLAPENLMLEFTERAITSDLEVSAKTLGALADKGLEVAIDDFGAGNASPFILKRLHIDTLRLTGKCIRSRPGDSDIATVVGAIVSMAHTLKLSVVAKDVETMEQLRVARSVRCDAAQGYLFAPPMPAERFEDLLKGRRTFPKAA